MVLYRVEEKAVQQIRIFSPDCELDAGGRTIQWLDGVNGADSVKLLATFVSRRGTEVGPHDRRRDQRHRDARDEAADAALERFAEPRTSRSFSERR